MATLGDVKRDNVFEDNYFHSAAGFNFTEHTSYNRADAALFANQLSDKMSSQVLHTEFAQSKFRGYSDGLVADRFRYTVVHEMGHVLGLHHEDYRFKGEDLHAPELYLGKGLKPEELDFRNSETKMKWVDAFEATAEFRHALNF